MDSHFEKMPWQFEQGCLDGFAGKLRNRQSTLGADRNPIFGERHAHHLRVDDASGFGGGNRNG